MAQPGTKQPSPIVVSLGLIGMGLAMTVGSYFLGQIVPIRLFAAGLIFGPIFVILGLLTPFIWLFQSPPELPILIGSRAPEMIGFHCRKCVGIYLLARHAGRSLHVSEVPIRTRGGTSSSSESGNACANSLTSGNGTLQPCLIFLILLFISTCSQAELGNKEDSL